MTSIHRRVGISYYSSVEVVYSKLIPKAGSSRRIPPSISLEVNTTKTPHTVAETCEAPTLPADGSLAAITKYEAFVGYNGHSRGVGTFVLNGGQRGIHGIPLCSFHKQLLPHPGCRASPLRCAPLLDQPRGVTVFMRVAPGGGTTRMKTVTPRG